MFNVYTKRNEKEEWKKTSIEDEQLQRNRFLITLIPFYSYCHMKFLLEKSKNLLID